MRPSAPSSRTDASSNCRSTAETISSSSRLSPNVSAEFAGPGQAGDRQGGTRANQQLSISGQRREFNNYTLDGVDNTDVNFNTYIFLPSVDALEEFKVQTGVYSAEFGRGASQVNVVTKSGTNSLHGTVFEFHRDDALDARPYAFTPAQAAAPKAPFKWDQYGYTAGGPVWKNHLFFMSNFEGLPGSETVPESLQRAVRGDAGRQLLGAVGKPRRHQPADRTANRGDRRPDPVHRRRHDADLRAVSGQHHSREPHQCHLQAAARVLSGAELRRRRTRSTTISRCRIATSTNTSTRSGWTCVQSSASILDGPLQLRERERGVAGVEVERHEAGHAGSSGRARQHLDACRRPLVNEFRFGFNYFFNTFGRELAFERDVVKELNIPGISLNPPEAWGIPSIGITGFSGFGDSTEGPYTNRNQAFEFSDNLSWIRGRHSFKVGGSIRYDMYNQVGNQFARGNFQFQNIATGYAFADFLLGYTQQTESAVALAVTKFRALSQAYYFTDTWKVRSNMTFDLGLRYEYTPPWLDKNGTLMNAYIPFHDTTPNVQDRRLPSDAGAHRQRRRLRGHRAPLRPEHSGGARRPPWRSPGVRRQEELRAAGRLGLEPEREVVGPRRHRHLLHAGHRQPALRHGAQPVGTPSRQHAAADAGPDVRCCRSGASGAANDCGVAPPLVCLTNVYVLGNMPNRKTPYMWQYLFNVQRELGGSTALEIGYLGSRSYRLERMFDWNETIPGVTGSVQSRKPYPEFTKVQEIGNVAEAKYNSLAVKLTRRLHDGLSVLGGYTLSKSTDNGSGIRTLNGDTLFPQDSFCLECEWALSIFDVRHRFVSSVLYELPFGDGKPFLQTASAARSSAAGRSARSSRNRADFRET